MMAWEVLHFAPLDYQPLLRLISDLDQPVNLLRPTCNNMNWVFWICVKMFGERCKLLIQHWKWPLIDMNMPPKRYVHAILGKELL